MSSVSSPGPGEASGPLSVLPVVPASLDAPAPVVGWQGTLDGGEVPVRVRDEPSLRLGPDPLGGGSDVAAHSYGRRVTARNAAALERGINPGSGLALPLDGPVTEETCGSCARLLTFRPNGRNYFKCSAGRLSRSVASDVRASWPACVAWRDPATYVPPEDPRRASAAPGPAGPSV